MLLLRLLLHTLATLQLTDSSAFGISQTVVPAVKARHLPGYFTAWICSTQVELKQRFLLYIPTLNELNEVTLMKRNCSLLTFTGTKHQANHCTDTPNPFTQIHWCERCSSAQSSAKRSEGLLKRQGEGNWHLLLLFHVIYIAGFAVIRKKSQEV